MTPHDRRVANAYHAVGWRDDVRLDHVNRRVGFDGDRTEVIDKGGNRHRPDLTVGQYHIEIENAQLDAHAESQLETFRRDKHTIVVVDDAASRRNKRFGVWPLRRGVTYVSDEVDLNQTICRLEERDEAIADLTAHCIGTAVRSLWDARGGAVRE